MKTSCLIVLCAAGPVLVAALSVPAPRHGQAILHGDEPSSEEKYLIELEPGQTNWATDEGKWELRRVRTQKPVAEGVL